MKTFKAKSNNFGRTFTGSRTDAIEQVKDYFYSLIAVSGIEPGRYNFRADDESGFTIRVYNDNSSPTGFAVQCVAKWNAARN